MPCKASNPGRALFKQDEECRPEPSLRLFLHQPCPRLHNRPPLIEIIFGDVSYFEHLKQAKITPPSWAFGPAWLVNNISVLWGTWQVLNKPQQTPGRTAYLTLQGLSWVDFVLFNAAYFSLRSPLNALVLIFVMFLLTIVSGLVALFRLKDTKVALSLATLFLWLVVALTAATFQALWNKDDFYQVGPFVKPPAGLVKKAA